MRSTDIYRAAIELPREERLDLARQLFESVFEPIPPAQFVNEGIRRIEDVATGCVVGLTEEQYRAALQ